jgi:hypothetical protein
MNNSYTDFILLFIGLGFLLYYIFFMIKNDIDFKTNSYVLEPNTKCVCDCESHASKNTNDTNNSEKD